MARRSLWDGAPDWIRTSDLRLRRPTLYPAELRAQCGLAIVPAASAGRKFNAAAASNAAFNSRCIGRQSLEEIDDAGLQGIFGAHDHEPRMLNQIFDDVGPMT